MTFDPKFASREGKEGYAAGLAKAAADLADPPLTLADVRAMSAQEIMARKREVDEVLRAPTPGEVEGEDGGDDD